MVHPIDDNIQLGKLRLPLETVSLYRGAFTLAFVINHVSQNYCLLKQMGHNRVHIRFPIEQFGNIQYQS